MTNIFIPLISIYQKLEPARNSLYASIGIPISSCKYQVTCSEYSKQSIKRYGTIKGLYLSIKRFLSCRP